MPSGLGPLKERCAASYSMLDVLALSSRVVNTGAVSLSRRALPELREGLLSLNVTHTWYVLGVNESYRF